MLYICVCIDTKKNKTRTSETHLDTSDFLAMTKSMVRSSSL